MKAFILELCYAKAPPATSKSILGCGTTLRHLIQHHLSCISCEGFIRVEVLRSQTTWYLLFTMFSPAEQARKIKGFDVVTSTRLAFVHITC